MNTETNTAPTKILSASDKIAMRVIEQIRNDRSSWEQSEHSDKTSKTITFGSLIGTAKIAVARKEVAGKKSKEYIARSSIVVIPESGKTLTITGPLAARAWFALTHAPKGRATKEVDLEAIRAASAALGL